METKDLFNLLEEIINTEKEHAGAKEKSIEAGEEIIRKYNELIGSIPPISEADLINYHKFAMDKINKYKEVLKKTKDTIKEMKEEANNLNKEYKSLIDRKIKFAEEQKS